MRYLLWVAEPERRLEPPDGLFDPATASALEIVATICMDAYLDGFAALDVPRVAARTGLSAEFVERTVAELVDLGIMRFRIRPAGMRLVEPAAGLRSKCRLLGWFDPMERGTWR